MISEQHINGTETVTGSKTFTTVSESVIIPLREQHGQLVTCRAQHEALSEPTDRSLKLNVKSKL